MIKRLVIFILILIAGCATTRTVKRETIIIRRDIIETEWKSDTTLIEKI